MAAASSVDTESEPFFGSSIAPCLLQYSHLMVAPAQAWFTAWQKKNIVSLACSTSGTLP